MTYKYQPEYETRGIRFENHSWGANLMLYDTLIDIKHTLKIQSDSLLSVISDKNTTSAERREALVELMASKGAPINVCTARNVTPLLLCLRGRLSKVAEILLKYGADPNMADTEGCTPLMIAAQAGLDAIVERLLISGADPNAQLSVKRPNNCKKCSAVVAFGSVTHSSCDAPFTALAFAAERGHQSVVELLLRYKANPNLKIVDHVHGRLPSLRDKRRKQFSWSPSTSEDELDIGPEEWKGYISKATALTWARGAVRDLLLRHGADPNVEEPRRECDCIVEKRKERSFLSDSDDSSNGGSGDVSGGGSGDVSGDGFGVGSDEISSDGSGDGSSSNSDSDIYSSI